MDTLYQAIDKLNADQMIEFWKEFNKVQGTITELKEETKMEEQEVWNEVQELAKKLNYHMRLAVSMGLRVECTADSNMREIQWKHVIPRVEVAVYKEMKNA